MSSIILYSEVRSLVRDMLGYYCFITVMDCSSNTDTSTDDHFLVPFIVLTEMMALRNFEVNGGSTIHVEYNRGSLKV